MSQQFNDNSLMPFGKYIGKRIGAVPAPYLLWLFRNGCSHSGIRQYIMVNLADLQSAAAKIPRR